MKSDWRRNLQQVNKELWLLLSIFLIALVVNSVIAGDRMLLGLYSIPTLLSAYLYGRRHAVLTSFFSIFLAVFIIYFKPRFLPDLPRVALPFEKWFDVMAWAGILVITAYFMGTLYERKKNYVNELRDTYHGILLILRQFISKDKYTQNHSYRVSVYAAKIASYLGFDTERIEDVRTAALLHDIGKLDISRDILYKAARLTQDEYSEMKQHVEKGVDILQPVGGSLRRILPIILAHHDKFDGSGYHPTRGEEIPLEARIISVADVYDSLASDRPYRKAMSPIEAKEAIVKGAGTDFDPGVVEAFVRAFTRGEMEVPEVIV